MLHVIMPNQISGPNTSTRVIMNSKLADKYDFGILEQHFHAGGTINFKLIKDLKRQIREFDPELVHLSGLQAAGFHAVVAAKLARKKILLTVHGFSVDALNISSFQRIMYRIVEIITLLLSDGIYTVCDSAKERREIQRFKWKVFPTIHNAAPRVGDDLYLKRDQMRSILGLSKSDIAVVISGRMTKDKGILDIIKSIQMQRGNIVFNKCRYLFVGEGPSIEDIEKNLADEVESGKVICLGKRNDVLEILSASDIFLFATLHENLSNALLEAMACGLPVIATKVGGNPEVVIHNENGYLIPKKAPESIITALHALLIDEKKRNRFGERSKDIAISKFSDELLYQKINTVYIKMLQS